MSSEKEMIRKNFSSPDEKMSMEKGSIDLVNIGNLKIGRFTLEPGWTWEKCEKPITKTESCQMTHQAYLISGRIAVKMTSTGKEIEFVQGDIAYIPPGHDARVIGNEPVIMIDVTGMNNFAKS
jgi:mannose-6-phosphate isomerase-like protein (cupin superfamily)